jgi:phosphatidylglycerophosphatase A
LEPAITFDPLPLDSPNAPILATVRSQDAPAPAGYKLADERPAATHVALHEFLDGTLPGLGAAFRPTGLFHHVGSRPCATKLPNLVEQIWIAADLPLPPSPPHPLFITAATVGPIGHLPVIGATTASAIAPLLAALAATVLPWSVVLLLTAALAIVATALCILAESAATRHFLDPDAREFVLDEVAGSAIAVCFVPSDHIVIGLVLAFVTFRLFDVLKPGIQWIELQPWRGKVAWDDVAAGFYAGLTTALITFVL